MRLHKGRVNLLSIITRVPGDFVSVLKKTPGNLGLGSLKSSPLLPIESNYLEVGHIMEAQTWYQWSQWVSSKKQVFRICLSSIWTHCYTLVLSTRITHYYGVWNRSLKSPRQTLVLHQGLQKEMKGEDHLGAKHQNGTWRPYLDSEKGFREFGSRIIEMGCSISRRSVQTQDGLSPGFSNLVQGVPIGLNDKSRSLEYVFLLFGVIAILQSISP